MERYRIGKKCGRDFLIVSKGRDADINRWRAKKILRSFTVVRTDARPTQFGDENTMSHFQVSGMVSFPRALASNGLVWDSGLFCEMYIGTSCTFT